MLMHWWAAKPDTEDEGVDSRTALFLNYLMGKAVDADKTGCHLSSKPMKFFYVHIQELLRYLNSAVMATFQNRVVLVQGPPGTGKTTTSAAFVCIHRCVTRGCLVCTSSYVAADTFGAVLKKKNEPFSRFRF